MRLLAHYFIILSCILSGNHLYSHGFGENTMVKGWKSAHSIKKICEKQSKYGEIVSYNLHKNCCTKGHVQSGGRSQTNCYVRIRFENPSVTHNLPNDILCTPAQEFWVPIQDKWLPACELKAGDVLKSDRVGSTQITAIDLFKQPLDVYILDIKKHHNLFVGEYAVLTHNMALPWASSIGFMIPFGEGAAAGGSLGGCFGPVGLAGGIVIGGLAGWLVGEITNNYKMHQYKSFFDVGMINAYMNAKNDAKAPGIPTEKDGFRPPKRWDGKKVRHATSGQYGWPDDKGNVWVPSGPGPLAHGGPHWDVVDPKGGYKNVVPGGRIRGQK